MLTGIYKKSEKIKKHLRLIANNRKGKHLSEDHKKKIGRALKGRHCSPRTEFKKGHIVSEEIRKKISKTQMGTKKPWVVGYKRSLETGRKNSEANKGVKSYFWKGGITPVNKAIRNSIEFRLWREAIFARDNWTCQKTGRKGGRLHPHHIKNFADYPELRFAIDNGITLDESSHKEFHRIYGNKNNSEEQLKEFLTTKTVATEKRL